MADILKVYTAEQLLKMYKDKILSDAVGLTDFNDGSKVKSILESNSEIISSISMDHKEALYKAIPIALYQGFGFPLLGATSATGYIRPYRRPAMTIEYTGVGTVAALTTTATTISATVTGAGGDNFSYLYSGYLKTSDLVTEIDSLANWSATLVKDVDSDTLYQYAAVDVLTKTDYQANAGVMDLMLATDIAIAVPTGFSTTINGLQTVSTADATILAGTSGIQCASNFPTTGTDGNIIANAIDTANGKGYINSNINGIENAINDSAFSGGAAAETATARQTRFSETVNALNAGTKYGIVNAIKGITTVRSVGMRAAYPFKGTNTIIVDDGTQTISTTLLAAIEKVLYGDANDFTNYPGKNAEGIGYIISAPTIVDVTVAVTAYRLSTVDVDLTEIGVDVKSAIEQYINTRGLGEDVVLSEIVRVGKNSNSAVWDLVVTSPATNTLIAAEEFAKTGSGTLGTVTVTMVIQLLP